MFFICFDDELLTRTFIRCEKIYININLVSNFIWNQCLSYPINGDFTLKIYMEQEFKSIETFITS